MPMSRSAHGHCFWPGSAGAGLIRNLFPPFGTGCADGVCRSDAGGLDDLNLVSITASYSSQVSAEKILVRAS